MTWYFYHLQFNYKFIICAKLCTAMLLLLGLLGGANSTLLVSSINNLLTYLQVNSSLLFTSNDTIAYLTIVVRVASFYFQSCQFLFSRFAFLSPCKDRTCKVGILFA